MVVATKLASSLLLLSLLGLNESFLIERNVIRVNPPRTSLFMIDSQFDAVPRRFLLQVAVGAMLPAVLVAGASPSRADVSDGNALPQGAQQFARVLKLKTDLKDVAKRLTTAAEGEIDKTEWDNIGKFLRTVYSIAENEMKVVAKGIFNPDNQKQALKDAEEIKKYSQAGDVSVSKQDNLRLASILTKISELMDDFLESLSDIPDEI